MPNRILKESICTNEQIDGLTAFEETVFYRLIVICDDFGRFDGRISVLKGRMFPLRDDKLKTEALEKAMKSLVQAGLVMFYKAEGKPYLHLTGWKETSRDALSSASSLRRKMQTSKRYLQAKAMAIICHQMMGAAAKNLRLKSRPCKRQRSQR